MKGQAYEGDCLGLDRRSEDMPRYANVNALNMLKVISVPEERVVATGMYRRQIY